jgi:hypothetical protein
VPSDVTDVVLDFWFAVTTLETYAGYDWFCAGMANPANHGEIWVDLGCIDATDASGYWQEVIYTLDPTEVAAIAGQSVDLVFEQWSDVDFYGDGAAGTGGTRSMPPAAAREVSSIPTSLTTTPARPRSSAAATRSRAPSATRWAATTLIGSS